MSIADFKEAKRVKDYLEVKDLYNKAKNVFKEKYNISDDEAKIKVISLIEKVMLKEAIGDERYIKEELEAIIKKEGGI